MCTLVKIIDITKYPLSRQKRQEECSQAAALRRLTEEMIQRQAGQRQALFTSDVMKQTHEECPTGACTNRCFKQGTLHSRSANPHPIRPVYNIHACFLRCIYWIIHVCIYIEYCIMICSLFAHVFILFFFKR